jgi:hypothetical protein
MPVFMPPAEILSIILEKLFSCPNKAIPVGPIILATTLTLIKPVSIRTRVETAFSEETLTRSAEIIFFSLEIIFKRTD